MPFTLPNPQQKLMPSVSRDVTSVPAAQISAGTDAIAKGMFSIAQAVERYQADLDETSALNAVNSLREQHTNMIYGENGLHTIKGNAVLSRPVFREFSEQFTAAQDKAASSLTGQARKVFERMAATERNSFNQEVMKWTAMQGDAAMEDSYKQTVKVLADNAALDPGNAEKIGGYVAQLETLGEKRSLRLGFDDMQKTEQRRESVGVLRAAQVNSLIKRGDLPGAQSMLRQFTGDMRADDVLSASMAIRTEYETQAVNNIGRAVTAGVGETFTPAAAMSRVVNSIPVMTVDTGAGAPPAAPSRDEIHRAVIQIESGGNPDVVSTKGAKGRYQVMPDTAKSPGFGLAPVDFNNPEERDRLGAQYLDKMLEKYGGDVDLAVAATNAGPGAIDRLLARHGDKWRDHLLPETSNHLAKLHREMGGGTDAPKEKHSWESMVRRFPGNTDLAMAARFSQEPDAVEKDYKEAMKGAGEAYLSGNPGAISEAHNRWFQALPEEIKDKIDKAKNAMEKGLYANQEPTTMQVRMAARAEAQRMGLSAKKVEEAEAKAEAMQADRIKSRNQMRDNIAERYMTAWQNGGIPVGQISQEDMVALGPKEAAALRDWGYGQQDKAQERSDRAIERDPEKAAKFLTFYNGSHNEIAALPYASIMANSSLTHAQKKLLIDRKAEIIKNGTPSFTVDRNVLESVGAEMGIDFTSTSRDRIMEARVIMAAEDYGRNMIMREGRKPDLEKELKPEIKRLVTTTIVKDKFWSIPFTGESRTIAEQMARGEKPLFQQSEIDQKRSELSAKTSGYVTDDEVIAVLIQELSRKQRKEKMK